MQCRPPSSNRATCGVSCSPGWKMPRLAEKFVVSNVMARYRTDAMSVIGLHLGALVRFWVLVVSMAELYPEASARDGGQVEYQPSGVVPGSTPGVRLSPAVRRQTASG